MANKNQLTYLWAVAGIYLIYLGAKQIMALLDGSASVPVLNAISGIVFIVFGAGVVYREWKNYRRASAQKDEEPEQIGDPEGEEDL